MQRRQHPWLATPVAATLILLALVFAEQPPLRGQMSSVKLTTVLADLAGEVPQDASAGATVSSLAQPLVVSRLAPSIRDAVQSRRLRFNDRNEVQVSLLVTGVTDAALTQLADAGATVEIPDARSRRIQARVPASRLQLVASLPFVTFVRLPAYARRNTGSITTEGDAILNADVTRQQFGLDGTGVKVGVISDGVKGIFATSCSSCGGDAGGPIATGDLPSATGARNAAGILISSAGGIVGRSFASNSDLEGRPPSNPPCGFAGAGAEGTALLEVVHDLAPGAALSFSNADTDLAFNNAVNSLAASNDVVVDDLGFYGEPDDGTSNVSVNTAAALNNPSNRIRAYVTSVGNSADEHYIGGYVDSGVDGTTVNGISSRGHLHLFQRTNDTTDVLGLGSQPYNVISLPNGGEVAVFLTWDDPAAGSSNNYDLYLVRQSTNTVVARSTDTQSGSQDPFESIDFTNTGATDFFRIVVQNVGDRAAARQLNLFSFEPECANDGPRLLVAGHHERHNFNTASKSVVAQGDAGGSPVSVISVGAICSGSPAASAVFAGSAAPDESCGDHTHSTIEFYSSIGPTLDGRNKPDISAVDGISVTGAGSFENPFFGTSAAGPHVAAEAALLLQAAPCLVSGANAAIDPALARGSLRGLIVNGATPETEAPPDPIFGAGLANALTSVQHTLPTFSGLTALVVAGNSPTGARLGAADLGFRDPDQCQITALKWTGGCGTSPGGALACPFGTANVNVSATNNGLAFSPASSVQITVSNFAVVATPSAATVKAGQAATYRLTVSASGGAFQNAVALSCANLPAGSSCLFSPSTIVPGAGSVDSVLTINTSSRAELAPLMNVLPAMPVVIFMTICAICAESVRRVFRTERADGRRAGFAVVVVSAAVAIAASGVACGGGAKSKTSPPASTSSSVSISPASLTFASQPLQATSAPQAVTLTNSGTSTATISSVGASGDFAAASGCGSSLAAGDSCLIGVTFTPTGTGSRTGSLSLSDNASNSPQTVALSGTGVSSIGGTPAGTYQIAVAGASGTLVQGSSVSLTVQ